MTQLHSQLNTRAKVVATLERIQQGESLASLLDPLLNQVSEKDKGFAHELLLGTLRQWWALARIGESLIEHEVTDKGVWAALNIGMTSASRRSSARTGVAARETMPAISA